MVCVLRILLHLTLNITINQVLQIRFNFYAILLKLILSYMNNLINKNHMVLSKMEEVIKLCSTKKMIIII